MSCQKTPKSSTPRWRLLNDHGWLLERELTQGDRVSVCPWQWMWERLRWREVAFEDSTKQQSVWEATRQSFGFWTNADRRRTNTARIPCPPYAGTGGYGHYCFCFYCRSSLLLLLSLFFGCRHGRCFVFVVFPFAVVQAIGCKVWFLTNRQQRVCLCFVRLIVGCAVYLHLWEFGHEHRLPNLRRNPTIPT